MSYPSAASQVRPFSFEGFGPAYDRAVSLKDMAQQRKIRGIEMERAGLELDAERKRLASTEELQKAEALRRDIIRKHTKLGENSEPEFDDAAIENELIQSGLTEAADEWRKTADARLTSFKNRQDILAGQRKTKAEELLKAAEIVKKSKNQQQWARLRAAILRDDPEAQIPQMYDEATVDRIIEESNIFLHSEADRIKLGKERREEAEATKPAKEKIDQIIRDSGFDPETAPAWVRQRATAQVTKLDTAPPKEEKTDLIYAAYAATKKKDPATLTATEKLDAETWYEARKPQEQTDMQRAWTQYKANPEEFVKFMDAYRGGSPTDRSPTPAQIATAYRSVLAMMDELGLEPDTPEGQAYYEQQRKIHEGMGFKLPALGSEPGESSDLPKPKKPGESATDDIIDAYLKAHGNDTAAATKAMLADGWQ